MTDPDMHDRSDKVDPPADVSARALSIARAIDRLAPGHIYNLEISKPDTLALDWRVEIVREERIQVLKLSYLPE